MNIDDLKDVMTHCVTAQEASECCLIANYLGLTWASGDKFINYTNWNIFKEQTCYNFFLGQFSNVDYYNTSTKVYEIKTAQWFITNYSSLKELREWLFKRWILDNHKKYHKYFDIWFSHISCSQVDGFTKQMFNDKNDIIRKV